MSRPTTATYASRAALSSDAAHSERGANAAAPAPASAERCVRTEPARPGDVFISASRSSGAPARSRVSCTNVGNDVSVTMASPWCFAQYSSPARTGLKCVRKITDPSRARPSSPRNTLPAPFISSITAPILCPPPPPPPEWSYVFVVDVGAVEAAVEAGKVDVGVCQPPSPPQPDILLFVFLTGGTCGLVVNERFQEEL